MLKGRKAESQHLLEIKPKAPPGLEPPVLYCCTWQPQPLICTTQVVTL